jgi:hypothetical protein
LGNFYRLDKFLLLSNGELIIKAYSHPPFDSFKNIMNFSTGELTFHSHYKNKDTNRRSGLNATEVTAYQYLGIKGIFGSKYRRISSPLFFNFIEVVSRLKVLATLKENLPLSLLANLRLRHRQ